MKMKMKKINDFRFRAAFKSDPKSIVTGSFFGGGG